MRARLGEIQEAAKFRLRRPDWDAVLTEDLPFGADASYAFLERLESCSQYLEFGAGSSTLAVARRGCALVTVESDPRFLAAVERRCRTQDSSETRHSMAFLHADIGPTGPWGKPVMPRIRRRDAWRKYPLTPWRTLGEAFRADLVLVDGRFRVACALAVILNQPDVDWTLLVDDYADRPEYGVIERYAELVNLHGRMAEFRPNPAVSSISVRSTLNHFVGDWR